MAGFYSKDAIIETAFNDGSFIIWGILVITAGMTAFYSFRQVFFTFLGEERYKDLGFHPHEVPKYILVAMAPLAFLAITFGWTMETFKEFIYSSKYMPAYEMSHETHHWAWLLGSLVIILAVTGIVIAWKKYAGKGADAWKRDEKFEQSFIYQLVTNQYYVPKFYDEFIVQPYTLASAKFWEIDKAVVDGFVDFIGKVSYKTGDVSRGMQTGNLSAYLNWMGVGALLLIVAAAITALIG